MNCLQFCGGFLSILLIVSKTALAQAPAAFGQKLTPQAPETALLGTYGNTPLDLSTGGANISVPLGEVASGPLKWPISLGYRSTGITVSEDASWVGLGWVLNASGVITRSVRGLPDEGAETRGVAGYSDGWRQWRRLERLTPAGQAALKKRVTDGNLDTEPDVYNVSFGGRSAKIVFDTLGLPHIQPYATWRVAKSAAEWIITTEDGTRYLFAQTESSYAPDESPAYAAISAWHLTMIVSADGAHDITFQYRRYAPKLINAPGKRIAQKLYSWQGFRCKNHETTSTACCPEDPPFAEQSGPQFYFLQNVYLESISSETATARFYGTDNRLDVRPNEDPPALTLDSVCIREAGTGDIRRRFALLHTYVDATGVPTTPNPTAPLDYRLRLTGVREWGRPAYAFHYRDGLPSRASYAQDHWGYYNGAPNTTLIPRLAQQISNFYVGANNLAERGSTSAMLAGVLDGITYPTGGHTSFEYEPNVITTSHVPQLGEDIADVNLGVSVLINGPNAADAMDDLDRQVQDRLYIRTDEVGTVPIVDAAVLDLPYGATVTGVEQDMRLGPTPTGQAPTYATPFMDTRLIRLNAAGDIDAIQGRLNDVCFGQMSGPGVTQGCAALTLLAPGKYLLVAAAHEPDARATLRLSLRLNHGTTASELRNRLVGGLRLRRMVDNPAVGDSVVKTFSYTRYDSVQHREVSTGKLFYEPAYGKMTTCGNLVVAANDLTWQRVLADGYHIGYSRVTTHTAGGGSVETSYFNEGDASTRNLVTQELTRTATGQLVQKTSTSHDLVYSLSEVGAAMVEPVAIKHMLYMSGGNMDPSINVWTPTGEIIYAVTPYAYLNNWNRVGAERSWTFGTVPGSAAQQRKTTYVYRAGQGATPRITQPIGTRAWDEGEVRSSYRRFAADYDTSGTAYAAMDAAAQGVRLLQRRHVLSPVIEETTWRTRGTDSVVVGGQLTTYHHLRPVRVDALRLAAPLPAAQYQRSAVGGTGAFTRDLRYATLGYFDAYDHRGNLLQQHRVGDAPTAIVWGYNGTAVIAEASGATHPQLAYTSFEPGSTGRWLYDSLDVTARTVGGRTGRWAYRLEGGRTVRSRALPAATYELAWWATGSATVTVNGTPASNAVVVATTPGGWQCFRLRVVVPAGGVVSLAPGTAPVLLDEVRLSPVTARMTTYTHSPLQGISSQADAAGRLKLYEYDTTGRLLRVRDEQGRIQAEQEYHYARP